MYALSYRYCISFEVRKTLRIHEQNFQDTKIFKNSEISEFQISEIATKLFYFKERTDIYIYNKVFIQKSTYDQGGESPVATCVYGELISRRSIEPSREMYAFF